MICLSLSAAEAEQIARRCAVRDNMEFVVYRKPNGMHSVVAARLWDARPGGVNGNMELVQRWADRRLFSKKVRAAWMDTQPRDAMR